MTTLVSLILVYLLHRYLSKYAFFQSLQKSCHFDWVEELLLKYQMLANNFPKVPAIAVSALLIFLICISLLIVQITLNYYSPYLGTLLFNLILLFYCFSSAAKINYPSIFVAAFEHMFSMLFWFTIFGPIGLTLYWLFTIVASQPKSRITDAQVEIAKQSHVVITNVDTAHEVYHCKGVNNCLFTLHALTAWLPARITGLVFCLIGDFKNGFTCWKKVMKSSNISHIEFLDLCGAASLGNSKEDSPEFLLDRSFIAWLIICTIISLILYSNSNS